MTEAQIISNPEVLEAFNRVVLRTDSRLYPKEAVMAAAYVFVGRCYVLLELDESGDLIANLTGREPMSADALRCLAGEFGNELLAQVLRQRIAAQHAPLIGHIVGRSLAGATPPTPAEPAFDLAELEALELDDEPFDDPLGIAISWEDKYGDKKVGGNSPEGGEDA